MRAILNVVLFVLPFILYVGWLHLKEGNAFLKRHWERGPVIWLGLFGILLGVGGLALQWTRQNMHPDAGYVPARIENGRFVPGHLQEPSPGSRR